MADEGNGLAGNWGRVRYAGWGGAAALLLLPAVAMKAAPGSGVNWTASDFVFAAIMLGSVGLLLELTVRTSRNLWHRLGALVGVGTGFLLIWSNLAVGYIGDGSSLINAVFLAIPAIALASGVAVRFRSGAMAIIMLIAGAAHGLTGAIGFPQDPRTGPISMVFVALWIMSAALFRKAARG